jgi:hypothetical protein
MNELLEKILSGALTLLLFGWIWNRFQNRHDELEKRVLVIEQDRMTRAEFVAGLAASARDRREMHDENQTAMKELRDQIAAYEVRRSKTEHDILDVVNKLSVKSAAAEAVENYRNTHSTRTER